MNTHCLIFASDYSGSWRLYQSVNDALKFQKIMKDIYKVGNINTFLNEKYIKKTAIDQMKNLAQYLNTPGNVGIIGCFGHGDWQRDKNGDEEDGMDEVWKTHRRETIVDDEIADIFRNIHPEACLIVISDSCSSGTVLDLQYDKRIKCIAISSCRDSEDSIQTGDGSVMSYILMNILRKNPKITYSHLMVEMQKNMGEFIGNLQHFQINMSQKSLWDYPIFTNKKN